MNPRLRVCSDGGRRSRRAGLCPTIVPPSHPEVGARLLETTDFTELGEWILAHHERPDGTGYPQGRGGEEVPLEASILGVADAYEAMTVARSYRPPLDPQAASDELRRGAGRQFDERVVRALLRVV